MGGERARPTNALLRVLPTAEIEIAHSQPQPTAHRHHNRHNPGASRRGARGAMRGARYYYIWRNNRRRHRESKMGDISRLSVKCTRSSHESEILERDPRSISPLAMPVTATGPPPTPTPTHQHQGGPRCSISSCSKRKRERERRRSNAKQAWTHQNTCLRVDRERSTGND